MSRRVWFASACLLVGMLALGVSAAPATADESTPTPSPSPTSSGFPVPILPSPTPTATPVAPVTRLSAAAESGSLVASWQAGAGDTGFTAAATVDGTTKRVETTATTASFPGIRAGAVVRIAVTAHGAGGDAAPVLTTITMPSAIAPVTGAAMRATAAGLVVAWRPPADLAPGSRFLVELVEAGGGSRSRLVATSPVTFTGLTSGRLYSATITVVSGTSRSAAVGVAPQVWTAPTSSAGPVPVAPAPVVSAARPTATAAAGPAIAQPTAQRTLVSSPMAAAALAGAAVLLGGLAIGLLLRRPRRS